MLSASDTAFDAHFDALDADGLGLDRDGFEALAYALGVFPGVDRAAFQDLPARDEAGRAARQACARWWRRGGRPTPPPLAPEAYRSPSGTRRNGTRRDDARRDDARLERWHHPLIPTL